MRKLVVESNERMYTILVRLVKVKELNIDRLRRSNETPSNGLSTSAKKVK